MILRGERAWAALTDHEGRWDELVSMTPGIDHFCSGTDWIVPAHRTFGTGEVVLALHGEAAAAFALTPMARGATMLCGLDPMWQFARPVVGPDPAEAVARLDSLLRGLRGRWHGVLLGGVVPGSDFDVALRSTLGRRLRVCPGPATHRRIARLDGGLDAYLERRSAPFRRNARRARRRAEAAGVAIELVTGGGVDVVERVLDADRSTWKARAGDGLSEPRFAAFYRRLGARLAPSGRLRAGFARVDGGDVAYILGAVGHGGYRGFQLGYDAAHAELSLGNLLQLAQMEALVAEGVDRYDLGMDMGYKASWADEVLATETVVLLPR